MGVDVVGSVLCVIFENEDGGVVPVGAVGDGVDDAADGEIVVGDGSGGTGLALRAAGGVVVGEAQQDELRQRVLARFACGEISVEFIQEFISTKLVGIRDFEIGEKRIEMAAKFHLCGDIFGENRNVPGIWTGAAARIANVFFEWLAFLDHGAFAGYTRDLRRAAGWNVADIAVAPFRDDEFAIMAISDAVFGEILPEEAAGRFARVGQAVVGRDASRGTRLRSRRCVRGRDSRWARSFRRNRRWRRKLTRCGRRRKRRRYRRNYRGCQTGGRACADWA